MRSYLRSWLGPRRRATPDTLPARSTTCRARGFSRGRFDAFISNHAHRQATDGPPAEVPDSRKCSTLRRPSGPEASARRELFPVGLGEPSRSGWFRELELLDAVADLEANLMHSVARLMDERTCCARVFVERVSLLRRRLQGERHDGGRRAQDRDGEAGGVEPPLMGGAKYGREDVLGPAPCTLRLPPQTFRITTAGRIACSARQLVASMAGSPGKVKSAGASLVRWAANRRTAGRADRVMVRRSSICSSSRPRHDRAARAPAGDGARLCGSWPGPSLPSDAHVHCADSFFRITFNAASLAAFPNVS